MRGPIFSNYCEYRLTKRQSWRILYSVDQSKNLVDLVFLGEHTLPASLKAWTPPLTRVQGRTATKLHLDDIYARFAHQSGLTKEQIREVLKALRDEKQENCC